MGITMANDKLVGTWKLISVQYEFSDSKERVDIYGSKPRGYLIITEDQYFITIITSDGRQSPKGETDEASLFKSMMAYTGKFRLEEGDLLIINVAEVAWHPDWVGTEQARYFKLNGDELLIFSNQTTHPR